MKKALIAAAALVALPAIAQAQTPMPGFYIGAEGGLIFRSYLWQTAILSALGIALGLALGAIVPLLAAPLIEASLPFPAEIRLSPGALLEAAFYGTLSALIFTP